MTKTLSATPREDGFRMPGEFEAHSGCWMLWPEREDNWRLKARPAQEAFAKVAETIARFEPVTVGATARQYLNARRVLPPGVRLVEITANDAWMRDCGPTFVINDRGTVRGVDWGFNAWGGLAGGLYSPWDLDELVTQKVLEIERLDRYRADFILEGGSVHVDGEGTLLTTKECLLNPNRNPHLSQAELEERLRQYLNVEKIIWFEKGIYQDETSGHIDNLCCFARPGVVLLTWTEDPSDSQYKISRDAFQQLTGERDAGGRNLEVHCLHQPGPLTITLEESQGVFPHPGTLPRKANQRLAGSYVNFYLANGAVIAPVFDDPWDEPALEKLAEIFPEREVVGVAGREILLGGGNIHCITQQQPG
jgi:agmatine deiminase